MGKKTRSFLSAVALAFAVLFFGPATSDAQAKHHGPRYSRHHRSYGYARPYHGGYYKPYRPYRLVRVFVYDPFPRWIYRRVYSAPPVYYGPRAYVKPYRPY